MRATTASRRSSRRTSSITASKTPTGGCARLHGAVVHAARRHSHSGPSGTGHVTARAVHGLRPHPDPRGAACCEGDPHAPRTGHLSPGVHAAHGAAVYGADARALIALRRCGDVTGRPSRHTRTAESPGGSWAKRAQGLLEVGFRSATAVAGRGFGAAAGVGVVGHAGARSPADGGRGGRAPTVRPRAAGVCPAAAAPRSCARAGPLPVPGCHRSEQAPRDPGGFCR